MSALLVKNGNMNFKCTVLARNVGLFFYLLLSMNKWRLHIPGLHNYTLITACYFRKVLCHELFGALLSTQKSPESIIPIKEDHKRQVC